MTKEPVLVTSLINTLGIGSAGGVLAAVDSKHQGIIIALTIIVAALEKIAAFVARSQVSPVVKSVAEFVSEEDWSQLLRGGNIATTEQNPPVV